MSGVSRAGRAAAAPQAGLGHREPLGSPTVLVALVGLLRAGLTEGQISRLTDLRIRVQRGGYAADGGAGRASRGGAERGGSR